MSKYSSHEAQHHFSENEIKSYVDYINKLFENDQAIKGIIQIPIEPTEQLFEIIAKGVLLW